MFNEEISVENFINYCENLKIDTSSDIATEGKIKDFFKNQKEKRKQRIEHYKYKRAEESKAAEWLGEKYNEDAIYKINEIFTSFMEKQIYDVPLEGYTKIYEYYLEKQKEIPTSIAPDDYYNLARKEMVDEGIEALLVIIETCRNEYDKQNQTKALLLNRYSQSLKHYFGDSLESANESFISDISQKAKNSTLGLKYQYIQQ